MDFKALIEFNKYMLALSAACFAYALDKFVPMATSNGRLLVLSLLLTFFFSIVMGVIIFAAATSAQHPNKSANKATIEKVIAPLGQLHIALLIIGLIFFGWMLVGRVMTAPANTDLILVQREGLSDNLHSKTLAGAPFPGPDVLSLLLQI